MQFKIPQDVLRADKIVGPLTLRQLMILVGGGSLSYGIYMILNKQYYVSIYIFPVGITAILTLAFAFLSYKEIPFEKAILLLIEYMLRPRKLTWQKMQGDYIRSVLSPVEDSSKPKEIDDKEDKKKSLHEIIQIVDAEHKIK